MPGKHAGSKHLSNEVSAVTLQLLKIWTAFYAIKLSLEAIIFSFMRIYCYWISIVAIMVSWNVFMCLKMLVISHPSYGILSMVS